MTAGLKDKLILERLLAEKAMEGLNDGEFAAKIGITKQQFSDIKKGKRPIGTRIFLRAINKLGLSEEDFFPERSQPKTINGNGYAMEKLMKIIEQQERIITRLEKRILELEGLDGISNPLNGN